jgi:hypothetical protein
MHLCLGESVSASRAGHTKIGGALCPCALPGLLAEWLDGRKPTWRQHFNSLQTTVHKLFSNGLQLQAAYAYSRALDTQEYFNTGDPDVFGRYGLSTAYRPQRLAINYGYDLPLGKHEGILGKIASGWN